MKKKSLLLIAIVFISALTLVWTCWKIFNLSTSNENIEEKIQNSRLVQAFRITFTSSIVFALSPENKELKLESYLEIDPKNLMEFYDYGLEVQLLEEDKSIWQNKFYERTKKTLIAQPELQKLNESAFYLNASVTPTDSRLTTINLPILNKSKKYLLKITLTSDSYSQSAVIRLANIKTRTPEEALRNWKYVEPNTQDQMLSNLLTTAQQSRRDLIIKLMSRSLEYLIPEGKIDKDFYGVNLYIAKNLENPSESFIQPGGYLLGVQNTAIYQTQTPGKINFSAKFKDGTKVPTQYIESSPKLEIDKPTDILSNIQYLIKNLSGKPILLNTEFQANNNDKLTLLEPIFVTNSYYLIGPNLPEKIVADISSYPERLRIVTRAHFINTTDIGKKSYTVFFRALDKNNQEVLSGKYQAESVFETFDSYNSESAIDIGEAVGRRHVAYLYLPKTTNLVELESDKDILISLSTKLDSSINKLYKTSIDTQNIVLIPESQDKKAILKNTFKINEEICNQPKKTLVGHQNNSNNKNNLAEIPPNWFSFRPINFQKLADLNQYKVLAVASDPNCVEPLYVGIVQNSSKASFPREELEGVTLWPEKSYPVEIFEPINISLQQPNQNLWQNYWYTPLKPTNPVFVDPLPNNNGSVKIKFQLEKTDSQYNHLLVNSIPENTLIKSHTLTGKTNIKTDINKSFSIKLDNQNQNERFFINGQLVGEKPKEIWSEKNYFFITKNQPLSINIDENKEVITGVNFTTRFVRNKVVPNRINIRVTIENEQNKVVFLRNYSVLNIEDKHVIFSTRPKEPLSLSQRIFIPINKDLAKKSNYKITVYLLDDIEAYGRFFHFTKVKEEPKEEVNFWVEAKE